MTPTEQRRWIYLVVGLVVVALVGGFAAADLTSTVTVLGQNGFSFNAPPNTIYGLPGSKATASLSAGIAPACTLTGKTVNVPSGDSSVDVYLSGETACNTTSLEYFEWFSFASGPLGGAAPSPSDTFAISCDSVATVEVTITYAGLTSTSVVTTNVYYDLGPTASSAPCTVTINGS
jgi:hypothetical protein